MVQTQHLASFRARLFALLIDWALFVLSLSISSFVQLGLILTKGFTMGQHAAGLKLTSTRMRFRHVNGMFYWLFPYGYVATLAFAYRQVHLTHLQWTMILAIGLCVQLVSMIAGISIREAIFGFRLVGASWQIEAHAVKPTITAIDPLSLVDRLSELKSQHELYANLMIRVNGKKLIIPHLLVGPKGIFWIEEQKPNETAEQASDRLSHHVSQLQSWLHTQNWESHWVHGVLVAKDASQTSGQIGFVRICSSNQILAVIQKEPNRAIGIPDRLIEQLKHLQK